MSYKFMFTLNALVALVAGLASLAVPNIVLGYFGSEMRVPELLLARFFGMSTFVLGLVLWFVKDVTDASVQKNLGVVLFIGSLIGLVVSIIGVSPLSGVLRLNSWMPPVFFALSGLLYGFMLFLKPKMKE